MSVFQRWFFPRDRGLVERLALAEPEGDFGRLRAERYGNSHDVMSPVDHREMEALRGGSPDWTRDPFLAWEVFAMTRLCGPGEPEWRSVEPVRWPPTNEGRKPSLAKQRGLFLRGVRGIVDLDERKAFIRALVTFIALRPDAPHRDSLNEAKAMLKPIRKRLW